MYKKKLACIAYQAFHNLAPDDINSNYLFTKHRTPYNLRDNLRLELVCCKFKVLHDYFNHRASIVWNCLPSQLKSKPSYPSFKANVKKFSKCYFLHSFLDLALLSNIQWKGSQMWCTCFHRCKSCHHIIAYRGVASAGLQIFCLISLYIVGVSEKA